LDPEISGNGEEMTLAAKILYLLLALVVCTVGCVGKPPPDPLAGWTSDISQDPKDLNSAIRADYQDYITHQQTDSYHVMPLEFFEDSAGRHAVRIEIFERGQNASWIHILIYDNDNNRTNIIKQHRRYQS
jgi:hypothetical protein